MVKLVACDDDDAITAESLAVSFIWSLEGITCAVFIMTVL